MNEVERAQVIRSMFLSRTGQTLLEAKGVIGELGQVLSESELHAFTAMNLFFLPMYGPAACGPISRGLPNDSRIISIDLTFLRSLGREEMVAIILHELGHLLHPEAHGLDADFLADSFAIEKGYAMWVISSLQKIEKGFPHHANPDGSKKRIEKIRLALESNGSVGAL